MPDCLQMKGLRSSMTRKYWGTRKQSRDWEKTLAIFIWFSYGYTLDGNWKRLFPGGFVNQGHSSVQAFHKFVWSRARWWSSHKCNDGMRAAAGPISITAPLSAAAKLTVCVPYHVNPWRGPPYVSSHKYCCLALAILIQRSVTFYKTKIYHKLIEIPYGFAENNAAFASIWWWPTKRYTRPIMTNIPHAVGGLWGAEAEIVREDKVTTMAVNDMAPWFTKTSVAVILEIYEFR